MQLVPRGRRSVEKPKRRMYETDPRNLTLTTKKKNKREE
jgi:hypothetical protein